MGGGNSAVSNSAGTLYIESIKINLTFSGITIMATKINTLGVTRHHLLASLIVAIISPTAWASCTYTVTNNWGSGFTSEIKVVNDTAQTVNNWSVSWQEIGANVTNAWNATLSGSNPYTATSLSWNGTLAPNASATFGFQANGTASAPKVTGSLCGASVSTSKSSTASSRSSAISSAASSKAVSSSGVAASSKSSSSVTNESVWVFEENDLGFCNASNIIKNSNTGYTATGYTDTPDNSSASVSWSLNTAGAKTYAAKIRFANASGNSLRAKILVNNNQVLAVDFPVTGAWSQWQTLAINLPLAAGNNQVKVVADSANGLPNIDNLAINGNGITPAACPAVSSQSSSSSSTGNTTCPSSIEGFATLNGGTTGGGNASPVTVTTLDAFKSAVSGDTPRVVVISGTIDTGTAAISIGSNKTLQGANKNATIRGGIAMQNVKNIIIRNLHIQGKGKGNAPYDTVASTNSTNIWYDHISVRDADDGLLDITKQSNFQTVSWSKFYYSDRSSDHRLASLNGSGGGTQPADWGKLRVTYHHNWWAENVDQRMPRVMYGLGHQYNNFFNSTGNSYCIGVGSYAAALIENNYFKGVKNPHQFMYDLFMHITARGNVYDNTSGSKDSGLGGTRKESGQDFNVQPFSSAPYNYKLDAAESVPSLVQRCAGPQ